MSIEALSWALNDAPVENAQRLLVLMGLANHADKHGRGAFPCVATLAEYARCSTRTVLRHLQALEDSGVIRRGDQALVERFRPDRRPVVYDLDTSCQRVTSSADDVTAVTSRGDRTGTHGVTVVSHKPSLEPSLEPSRENPSDTADAVTQETLLAEADPEPKPTPEPRSKRAVRLARHVCDSSPAMKARGFHPWREAVDAVLCVEPEASDERVLDVLRAVVSAGLAISRQNAVRSAEGSLYAGRAGPRSLSAVGYQDDAGVSETMSAADWAARTGRQA